MRFSGGQFRFIVTKCPDVQVEVVVVDRVVAGRYQRDAVAFVRSIVTAEVVAI